MSIDIKWLDSSRDIEPELWDSCFTPGLEGQFWYRALESARLEEQFSFLYGVLRENGRDIGIVPAFVFDVPLELVLPQRLAAVIGWMARGPLARLRTQRTFFVGNVAGECGHIGLRDGRTLRDVAPSVHAFARRKADDLGVGMLVWKDFANEDREQMDKALLGRKVFRIPSFPGAALPLVAGGFNAYLTSVPSERRWKIRNKLRRGSSAVPTDAQVIRTPGPSELDEIFPLFWQTYLRGKTKFERLTPQFFATIAREREAQFVVLRSKTSRRMLAFMLLLDLGDNVINKFIGIDYSNADGGYLYFQLFAAAYDWASRTGARTMLSGQTGYRAKLDLGHTLVPLWNYCEHRNGVVNSIFRRGSAAISWGTLDVDLRGYWPRGAANQEQSGTSLTDSGSKDRFFSWGDVVMAKRHVAL